jgi:hypothetical protein
MRVFNWFVSSSGDVLNGSVSAALSNVCVILVEVVADLEQHDDVERSRISRRYPKIRRDGAAAAFAHYNSFR